MRRWACRLLVPLLAAIFAAVGCHSGNNSAVIVQECKDAVTAHLAYPGDADFPFFDPQPTSDGSGGWTMSGTVAAKNAFGGSHTLRWTCHVEGSGGVTVHVG